MDVHCSTCGEPWDVYHLRHDAIFETDLSEADREAWSQLPREQKSSLFYRRKFKEAGYQFGASIVDVRRCPCCPKEAKPDANKVALKAALVEMLGEDEDG